MTLFFFDDQCVLLLMQQQHHHPLHIQRRTPAFLGILHYRLLLLPLTVRYNVLFILISKFISELRNYIISGIFFAFFIIGKKS